MAVIGSAVIDVGASTSGFARDVRRGITSGVVGVGGLVAAALGVKDIVTSVATIGSAFTDQINTFASLGPAYARQIDAVRAKSRELGNDLTLPTTSASDAAAAMVELAKGGLTAAQAMDAAKGSLLLATAGQLDGARAAQIEASALNQFGLAGRDASHVADVLANTANAAAGGVDDIALALKYVGPVAHGFKISMDDTAAAVGLLANKGILADTAGTSLRTMLVSLAKPTQKGAEGLKELGIRAFDAHGRFVGLRPVIDQLSSAQGRLTDKQFAAASAMAFGREPLAAITALAQSGGPAFSAMASAVGRQGGAAEVAAAKTKGLGGAFRGLQSQFETMRIDLYNKVQPGLERTVRRISDVLPTIVTVGSRIATSLAGPLGRAFSPLIDGARAAVTEVGGILEGLTNTIPAPAHVGGSRRDELGAPPPTSIPRREELGLPPAAQVAAISDAQALGLRIRTAIDTGFSSVDTGAITAKLLEVVDDAIAQVPSRALHFTQAFSSLILKVDWVSVGTVAGRQAPKVIAGLAAGLIVAAGILVYDFVTIGGQLIQGLMTGIGQAIGDLVGEALHLTDEFEQAVRRFFGIHSPSTVMATIGGELIAGLVLGLVRGGGALLGAAARLPGIVLRGLGNVTGRLVGAGASLAGGFVRGVAGHAASAASAGAHVVASGARAFAGLAGRVVGGGASLAGGFVRGVAGRAGSAAAAGAGVVARGAGAFAGLAGRVVSGGTALAGGFVRGVAARAGAAATAGGNVAHRAIDAVTALSSGLVSAGADLVRGFITGIGNLAGEAASAAGRMAQGAIDTAKSWLHIGSPSRVFHTIGQQTAQGLANGIDSGRSGVAAAAARAVTAARNAAITALPNFLDALTGTPAQIRSATSKMDAIIRRLDSSNAVSSGTAHRLEAQLARARSSLLGLATTEANRYGKALSNAESRLGALITKSKEYAAGVADAIRQTGDVTTFGGPAQAIAGMTNAVNAAKRFEADLTALKRRGLNGTALDQLAQAGVATGGLAARNLATATDAQLRQINTLQSQLGAAATATGNTAAANLYGAGIRAAQGIVDGLKHGEAAIERQMERIARSMTNAIKRALGIRSPSSLMRDEVGAQIMAGIAAGIGGGATRTALVASRSVRETVAAARAAAARATADPLLLGAGGGSAGMLSPAQLEQLIDAIRRGARSYNVELNQVSAELSGDDVLRLLRRVDATVGVL